MSSVIEESNGRAAQKKLYKNKGKNEEFKQKRKEESVQLRKEKRHDQLLKRRNICMEDLNTSPLKELNCQEYQGKLMPFERIVEGIQDDDNPKLQFECTQNARKTLSRERHPPISKMVEANILNKLVQFLSWSHNVEMQFEAAWALTNIASGNSEQTLAVVHSGAVPELIKLLSHSSLHVVEQAMWALGNIAGDGANMRNYVLDKGIIQPLIAFVSRDTKKLQGSFLQNLTWTLSNLCRNKNPHTSLQCVNQMLPSIVKLVREDDLQVKTDVCWALSYITDGPNDRIELVLKTGIVEELVRILQQCKEGMLVTPVLRVIGNIVTGSDVQTQRVIDYGALSGFERLLSHDKPTIQKEAAWAISNVTAGTSSQIQSVIDAGLIPPLIHLLSHGDFKTQKEACWAITNFTSGATTEQLIYLANNKAIEGLCGMLKVAEAKILQVCLDGLKNMLTIAMKLNNLEWMACTIEQCGGLDAIEELQQHDNEDVFNMAQGIIDVFFNAEEEDEDENVAPETQTTDDGQNFFQFGGGDADGGKHKGGFRL